jgi:hypothetical protein
MGQVERGRAMSKDKGSGDWVTDYENSDSCLDCKKPMWVEGYIDDDISLCHLCYEIKYDTRRSVCTQ